MRRLHAILSFVLTLALVAGAAVHGARAAAMAAAMAMETSATEPEACDLCVGAGREAAAQCALLCAGLTAIVGGPALLHDHLGDRPRPGASAPSADRFASPEPDPPR